jgi:hypothetical protein
LRLEPLGIVTSNVPVQDGRKVWSGCRIIIGRRKSKYSVRNLPPHHFVNHKSDINGNVVETRCCYSHNLVRRNAKLVSNNIFRNQMLADGYTAKSGM